MNMNKLIEQCHGAAVAGGWWNDTETGESIERNKGELLCLVHSEISEVLEGLESGAYDDHLTDRRMEEVELVDVLIRVFDYAGGFGLRLENNLNYRTEDLSSDPYKLLCEMHAKTSAAMESARKGCSNMEAFNLEMLVSIVIYYASLFDYDLEATIQEKLAYNAKRADHKPANREKDGGKKF